MNNLFPAFRGDCAGGIDNGPLHIDAAFSLHDGNSLPGRKKQQRQ